MREILHVGQRGQEEGHYSPILLTEPIIRPDGILIETHEVERNVVIPSPVNVTVSARDTVRSRRGIANWYSYDEVVSLGIGDFEKGLARIGQEHFSLSYDELVQRPDKIRPLEKHIQKPTPRTDLGWAAPYEK